METIHTQRLILREMRRSDVDGLHMLFSDPLLMRFWPIFKRTDTAEWVEDSLRRYERDGFGMWTLTLRGSDEAVGDCGMIRHDVDGVMETGIGWHLRRDLWGQGLATEAALASRVYAFERMGVRQLVATIHPANVASRRVAEKIGMTLWKQFQHPRGLRVAYLLERGE